MASGSPRPPSDPGVLVSAWAAGLLPVSVLAMDLLLRLSGDGLPSALVVVAGVASLVLLTVATVRSAWLRAAREPGPANLAFRLFGVGYLILYPGFGAAVVLAAAVGGTAGALLLGITLLTALPLLGWGVMRVCWPRRLRRTQWRGVIADTALAAFALAIIWWAWVAPAVVGIAPGWLGGARLDAWLYYLAALLLVLLAALARGRALLPFGQLVLLHAVVAVHLAAGLLDAMLPWAGMTALSPALLGYVVGGLLFVRLAGEPAGVAESSAERRRREWYAALVPLIPLPVAAAVLVGQLAADPKTRVHQSEVLGIVILVALLTGLVVLRALASSEMRGAVREQAHRQLAASTQEKWFLALVGRTQDLVLVLDHAGRIAYATPSVLQLAGQSAASLRRLALHQLCGVDDASEVPSEAPSEVIERLLCRADDTPGEPTPPVDLVLLDSEGQPHEVEWRFTALQGLEFDGYLAHGRDVTADRRMRALLAESSRRDALTGLLSREGYLSRPPRRSTERQGLLVVNLMRFGRINDRLGHEAGDHVLQETARILRELPGPLANHTRLSGDTFAVQVAGPAPDVVVVAAVAGIREALQGLRLPSGQAVPIDISAGYALAEPGELEAEELVGRAELALARSRSLERSPLVRYAPNLREANDAAAEVEENLRSALRDEELVVLYQPIVRLADHSTAGVEALVRRRRADGSLEAPDVFIPLAEDLGLVDQVDYAVLGRALRDLRWVSQQTGRRVPVAVNISPRELDDGLEHRVLDALTDAGWEPADLIVEVTETTAISNPVEAHQMLQRLRLRGCQIALDDFGTGYATMAALADMPLDIIKIDSSFTARLTSDARGVALMRAVVQVGRSLGLTTVAEGLATVEQADLLRGMGCERAQGYLYSEPLTAEQLVEFLQPDSIEASAE